MVLIDDAVWARFIEVAFAEPDAPDVKMILEMYRWLLKISLTVDSPLAKSFP